MKTREVLNEINDYEIEGRDEAAEQQHRDDHDHRGISQLLEPPNAFVLRFPRPRRFSQLGANFADKIFRVCDHENVSKTRSGGTRTPNRRFWRPLLYQLSY